MSLALAARAVRDNAYAPYSNFKVGAALRGAAGAVFSGCNVENVAYPEGTCAEAGAIAAMVAAGRQKLLEFGAPDTPVTLATTSGTEITTTLAELLPGAFANAHMDKAKGSAKGKA